MIRPEPITVDGRDGVVVFLDADGHPVEPQATSAVMAKAIFDDGGRAFYHVKPKTTNLGGAGSGNFGHVGRIGQVGGSGPGDGGAGEAQETGRLVVVDGLPRHVVKTISKEHGGQFHVAVEKDRSVDQKVRKQILGDEDPVALAMKMYGSMTGDVILTTYTAKDDEGRDVVVMSALAHKGKVVMTRAFSRDAEGVLNVEHANFQLPKGEQGAGMAKLILSDSFKEYERLGVEEVTMLANLDVGGYAWARYGIKADNPKKLAKEVMMRVNAMVDPRQYSHLVGPGMTKEQAAKVRAVIEWNEEDPLLPWHVSGLMAGEKKLGKKLLLGLKWKGRINLKDKEAMGRFWSYVRRPKES